jgi:hypothetical protein
MTDPLAGLREQARELAARRADIAAQAGVLAGQADAQRLAATTSAALGDAEAFAAAQATAMGQFRQRRSVLNGVAEVDRELAGLITALAGDPCDIEPDVPLALLPVRLETRYNGDGTVLRVRIYPDDVHVDRLDRGVSDEERAAGIAYWQAIWDGSVTEDAAWQAFVASVKPSRAEWVAAALSPDLTTRPVPPAAAPGPALGNPPALQQPAPVARALPDRFVVVAIQGGQLSRATGAPVPPELVVGLPPTADPEQLSRLVQPGGQITLGPGMQWLIDPAEAERVGMLVNVPLAVPGGPVERVLAFGVRASLDPQDSATELAALLEAHRYAEGAEFVAPGTPTNNTETDRADWTSRRTPAPPPTVATAMPPGADAALAAAALGLDVTAPAGLASWPGAQQLNQSLAEAASTALWQATWGAFIERLVAGSLPTPNLPDELREAWRTWWQADVRGGGPLPLLRMGDQPYGVLPVSSVQGSWQPDGSDPVEAPMLNVLRNGRAMVAGGLAKVASVTSGGPIDDTLLDVLGSAPHSLGIRVRSIGSDGLLSVLQLLFGLDPGGTNQAAQDELVETVFLQLGASAIGLRGVVGKTTRPLGLPLVLDDDALGDEPYVKAMLGNADRAVSSVLQALLEIGLARERDAVAKAAPPELVKQVVDRGAQLLGADAQRYIELIGQTQAGKIEPERLHSAADVLDARFGASGPNELAVLQPVAAIRTSLADVAMSPSLPSGVAQRQSITVLGAWLRAQARLAEFQSATLALVSAPIDQRGIAVAQTLDCASHRYDAWITSLPTRRVTQLRSSAPAGVLLGAYGWVEGLTPGAATTRAGGYVHAPSLTHAATAGVLRSGYLTHNRDAAGTGALSVDLTSARVRQARALMDGVRQGQPLGALLGYLIERLLHEQHLDVYTLSLRSLAPIAAGRLVDRADALPADAQEAVAANNVVDGIRLITMPRAGIWAKLTNPPADNPYLDQSKWPKIADNQAAVETILQKAAGAYGAVSDVLLAESVHHFVQGNTARAAAVMSAAAGGDAAPVEPEVVRTPTRAAALTHRVLLLLDDTAPGSSGWSADTPRAKAEPRLAAWAENRLGPATAIVVHVAADGTRTTLDAAGLSALDVVFDSAGATVRDTQDPQQPQPAASDLTLDAAVLNARLRAALPQLGTDPLPVLPDPAWPAGLRAIGEVAIGAASLHALIAGAPSVTPPAFARPSDQPARNPDATGLTARLQPVINGLSDAADALANALAAGPPPDPVAIADAADALRRYGISLPTATGAGATVLATAVLAEAAKRVTAANAIAAPYDATSARAAGEAVFGAGFVVLPAVSGAADLFSAVLGGVNPGRASIRRWLRDLATVRPDLARYNETLLIGDAAGSSPGVGRSLRIAQLAASGTAGTATWLGLPLPDGAASPDQPITDVLADAPAAYTGAETIAGLVVDEWVEQLPRRNPDGTATITTGLAINANAPNARAPQAILLAVSPDGSRWTSDALISVLTETRELAGLRAVTLERLATPSPILPAIQEQSWSLQGEPTLDLRMLATEIASVEHMLPYVKETGP